MPTVVVIDDDEGIREALHDSLELGGYTVLLCDGFTALETLRAAPRPWVALLDLVMPHVDGWMLMAQLAGCSELHGMPVIVCSAGRASDVPPGCSAFLRKPFTELQLLEAVRLAFETVA